MPSPDDHPLPSAAAAQPFAHAHADDGHHSPDPLHDCAEPPEPSATTLADLLAGLFGLLVPALAILIACGWLTTLWGALLLAALLFCPLILVLAFLLRP